MVMVGVNWPSYIEKDCFAFLGELQVIWDQLPKGDGRL